MRIGVIGINHKLADLKLRELLAKTCNKRFGPGMSIHGRHTFVLLSTCNRTEIYFSSDDLAETHSYILNILLQDIDGTGQKFDQKLYSYFDLDCFLHLAKVTAGLDSAVIAETEIQGQVKTAYETCSKYSKLPKDMHFMFQKSLKIGKKIRSKVLYDQRMPCLEHAVLNMGKSFQDPSTAKILFVGASEINRKILCFLKSRKIQDITICNRSSCSAQEFVERYQLKFLEWSELAYWTRFDWIIFGTKSSEYLLKREDMPLASMSHKLVLDLSVPRNVDPALAKDPKVSLFNIDQINKSLKIKQKIMREIVHNAELDIIKSTKRHLINFKEKEKFQNKLAIAL